MYTIILVNNGNVNYELSRTNEELIKIVSLKKCRGLRDKEFGRPKKLIVSPDIDIHLESNKDIIYRLIIPMLHPVDYTIEWLGDKPYDRI